MALTFLMRQKLFIENVMHLRSMHTKIRKQLSKGCSRDLSIHTFRRMINPNSKISILISENIYVRYPSVLIIFEIVKPLGMISKLLIFIF